jgi:CTP synthase
MAKKASTKFVFVTGGVISGLGKGISTASIASLLKLSGYTVSILKVDMYLNLDAGTINPIEHGEVFVTADGLETDQDIGNYERFLNQNLHRHNYMTMGQVYYDVITRERQLEYGGEDVEGHIHIPQEIIRRIKETATKDKADIMVVEVGGTVGEYQNVMFFEAIRRLRQQQPENVFLIHLVYLPKPPHIGEVKSKPAQTSIYELYKLGLQPNFVICRSEIAIDTKKKSLIAFNAGIPEEHIIAAPDADTIYQIPVIFRKQKLHTSLLTQMNLKPKKDQTQQWDRYYAEVSQPKKPIKIAIVGKYFHIGTSVLEDAYICVIEAIKHAAWKQDLKPVIQWFDVERFEDQAQKDQIAAELKTYDGIIVPQGWGSRGVEGKIATVQLARSEKIPYLGLCFGMQMAVIEYARHICGMKNANSAEVNPKTPYPVIHLMKHQQKYMAEKKYGGTIRLGQWPCKIQKGTLLHEAYQRYADYPSEVLKAKSPSLVYERHRHRYEVNNTYRVKLEKAGLIFSGVSPDGQLVEALELDQVVHPFFVGTQFHPEYQTRPTVPHPLFMAFIKAARSRI